MGEDVPKETGFLGKIIDLEPEIDTETRFLASTVMGNGEETPITN